MSPARILVVVPTYNEVENIERVLERLREAVPAADVLVVDDGSPDGTGALADTLAERDPQIQVMHRTTKDGLGAAYLAGFDWGLDRGYERFVEMDADGSHPPERLPAMLDASADADLVIGSRWVPGGAVENWPIQRQLLSRGGNMYTRILLGLGVHDVTAGYRVYRRETLERVDLATVRSQGYCFQVDLTRRTVGAGLRVVEVPITFVERTAGESKMSRDIVRESLRRITIWGVAHRVAQLRSLLPGFGRVRENRQTPSARAGRSEGSEAP